MTGLRLNELPYAARSSCEALGFTEPCPSCVSFASAAFSSFSVCSRRVTAWLNPNSLAKVASDLRKPDGLVVVQNANSGGAGPFLMEGNSFGVEKFDYEVSELKDLDRIPAPVHVVRPAVPARPAGGELKGCAAARC